MRKTLKRTGVMAVAVALLVAMAPTAATATVADDDNAATYVQNVKALTGSVSGVFAGVQVDFTYQVAVDQWDLRNGTSHKVWFIPESNKGLVVTAPIQGLRVTCPFKSPGSDSYTDEDLPLSCQWKIGYGGGKPEGDFNLVLTGSSAAANANTSSTLDNPKITINGKNLKGTFTYNGTDYSVSVLANRVKFRNGSSHQELVIPESHKKTVSPAFSGSGYQISCPFDSPGVDSLGANEKITCTWKAGYGSSAPTGTVVLG